MSRNFGRLAAVLCLAASALAQTPVISAGGVLNGASFRLAGVPGAGVAPGSIISIFGSSLASGTAQATSLPLPLNLNGTSVTIGGRAAPLFYVSPTQINAQLPWVTPVGSQPVVVSLNGTRSVAVNVTVTAIAPGIFTQTSSGHGAGAIQTFLSQGNTPMNNVTTAVAPGGILIIYATGLGAVSVPPVDGAAGTGQKTTNAVTVSIGGQPVVNADAAVLASGYVGLNQVNVRVPTTTPEGCFVPVQVLVGGQVSNVVTASVAKNGNCTTLASEATFAPNTTGGLISLTRTDGAGTILATFFRNGSQPATLDPVPPGGGGCFADVVSFSQVFFGSAGSSTTATLSAGPLTYNPPGGAVQTMNRDLTLGGIYSGSVLISPGAYTVSGNGGTGINVGAFSATLTLNSLFSAKTNAGTAVSQAQGFTASWDTCPDPNGKVIVTFLAAPDKSDLLGEAVCSALCSDLSLTVPSSALSLLPLGSGGVIVSYLAPPVRFTATGLDAGFFTYKDSVTSDKVTLNK